MVLPLSSDPVSRLGCRKDGAREVMSHSWFRSTDWEALLRRSVKTPWRPKLKGAFDTARFGDVDSDADSGREDVNVAEDLTMASTPYTGTETWEGF